MWRLWPMLFAGSLLLAQLPSLKEYKKNEPLTWLDAPVTKQWNRPGRVVPRAPRGAGLDPHCKADYKSVGASVGNDERSVAKAGWILTVPRIAHNDIAVVQGQASNDGMCRPLEYQEFVFVDGKFAGTLSPVLMHSRMDGAAGNIRVPGDGRIVADFLRYGERDPLCCASRTTMVEYEIVAVDGKVLVAVKAIKTHRND